MSESSQGAQGAGEERREPFVSQGDRPEVRLNPDTPLSELRVRDLTDILGGGPIGKPPSAEKLYYEKSPMKDVSIKDFTPDKHWKFEKNEKFELEIPIPVDPGFPPGPDPRLDQVIRAVSGMNNQLSQLTDQVAELQRRLEG